MTSDGQEGLSKFEALGSFRDFSSVRVSSAGLGKAATLGTLSVPPNWVGATPEMETEPVSPSSSATDNTAPPAAVSRPPARAFQEGLMGMMTGRPAIAHDDEKQPEGN